MMKQLITILQSIILLERIWMQDVSQEKIMNTL